MFSHIPLSSGSIIDYWPHRDNSLGRQANCRPGRKLCQDNARFTANSCACW